MLKVTIPSIEQYDEEKNEFFSTKSYELQLEHSLISLSKWESKWKKPYLSNTEKTPEEAIDYIRCMTLNSPTKSSTARSRARACPFAESLPASLDNWGTMN